MSAQCRMCELVETGKFVGGYDLKCLVCCARLVKSTRPSRAHQESMLECIARTRRAPSRKAVLDFLKSEKNES